MNKFFLAVLLCFTVSLLSAQNIDIDKNSGLVKVDGQDAFYLIKKNKDFMGNGDFSLQNMAKEELAYLAVKNVDDLPYKERGSHVGSYFRFTFSETANAANVFPTSFSPIKGAAKMIANARLIKDNKIDPKAERAFIVSNNGTILREPVTVVVAAAPAQNNAASKAPAEISLKENRIYNNGELIGTFKKSTDAANITTLSIYNKDESKIATATHNDNDINADWNIITVADNNKSTQILYNSSTPLEKLFKFLADKGFF